MKLKYFTLCLSLMMSQFIFAQQALNKYFLFPPQQIDIQQDKPAISLGDVTDLNQFLQTSIQQASEGKWKLNINDKTWDLCFVVEDSLANFDAYHLEINFKEIYLTAKNKRALRYGKQSLSQLFTYMQTENKALSSLDIQDWADFERRGFMLDISRDKVPSMKSLYLLIDQLADWRYNEFQLYTEHTFAYKNHPVVWENASPMTAEQIQALDAYCLTKGIDLVPNQNSFGHMENWLKHDEYLDLSECETDCNTIWGKRKRTALAPTNPKSLELMQELYAELLPNFSSPYANIGGDETVELGLGKSKAMSDKIGKGQVYLNFLKKLNHEVNENGKLTQFWGDIVLNHPELIKDIPKNMTALVWGYDAVYSFDENLAKFAEAGMDFYACPGTSSWRSEIGKNHNAFINLKKAAIAGKKHGAKGYMVTDWGDFGHFQPRAVSYPTMVLGASYAWNYEAKTEENLAFLLNQYVFKDETGYTAKALLTLGDAYLKAKIPEGNANAFHLMLRRYKWKMKNHFQTKHLNKKGLYAAREEIKKGLGELRKAKPTTADADILLQEMKQAADLALFGIDLGLARLDATGMATRNIPSAKRRELAAQLTKLIDNHKATWLVRNREGGLADSAEKLEDLKDYLVK